MIIIMYNKINHLNFFYSFSIRQQFKHHLTFDHINMLNLLRIINTALTLSDQIFIGSPLCGKPLIWDIIIIPFFKFVSKLELFYK